MSATSAKPKFTLSLPVSGGQIQAAVWENNREAGDESFKTFSVTLTRSYFDEESKQWKSSKTFRENDLPVLALVATDAFRTMARRTKEGNS